jgi:hypothetical protein
VDTDPWDMDLSSLKRKKMLNLPSVALTRKIFMAVKLMLNLLPQEKREQQDHQPQEEEEEVLLEAAVVTMELPEGKVILPEMAVNHHNMLVNPVVVDMVHQEVAEADIVVLITTKIVLMLAPTIITMINKIETHALLEEADLTTVAITRREVHPDQLKALTVFHQPRHCLSLICHISSSMTSC